MNSISCGLKELKKSCSTEGIDGLNNKMKNIRKPCNNEGKE